MKRRYEKLVRDSHHALNEARKEARTAAPSLSTQFARKFRRPALDMRIEQVRKIQRLLDTKFDRFEVQKMLHDRFVQCLSRVVFKDMLDKHQDLLREILDVDNFGQEVIVRAPRRFGKSWAVAMFVCVLLVVLPNVRIACFSTGKRASEALMSIVKQMLKGKPFYLHDGLFSTDAASRICLKFGTDDKRHFYAYPGSVHT